MIKWIKEKIGSVREKIQFRMKCRREDELWSMYGGSCFGMFPPSFYRKHSEEEIKKAQQEELAKLKKILQKYEIADEGKEQK